MVSNRIDKIVEERFQASVKFSKMDFSLFPLSMSLEDVKISKRNILESQVSSLTLNFTVWDFFRSDLRVNEVGVEDGFVVVKIKSGQSNQEIDLKKINLYDEVHKRVNGKLPFDIGRIYFKNIDVEATGRVYSVDNFSFSPYKTRYDVKLALRDIHYEKESIDYLMLSMDLSKDESRFIQLKFVKDLTTIVGKGKLEHTKSNQLDFDLRTSGKIPLYLSNIVALDGFVDLNMKIKGDVFNPRFNFELNGNRIQSPYVNLDTIEAKGTYFDKLVSIDTLSVKKRGGSAKLLSPVTISTQKFSLKDVKAQVNNLHSHDLLMFLGDDFKILNTRLSGEVGLSYIEEKLSVNALGIIKAQNMSVGYKNKLIQAKEMTLSRFKLTNEPGMTKLNAKVGILGDEIEALGYISSKDINIMLTAPKLEVSKIGGEIGGAVSGIGSIELKFQGPLDNVEINSKEVKLRDGNVLGYSLLEDSRFDLNYSFNNSTLKISNAYMKDTAEGKAAGFIDFDKEILKLNIKLKSVLVENIKNHIQPVWPIIEPYFEYASGVVDGKVDLSGSFSNLKIRTLISSRMFYYLGESFTSFNSDFTVTSKAVNIEEIALRKKNGKIRFNLNIEGSDIKSSKLDVRNINIRSLDNLKRFQFNYDGFLNGKFESRLVNNKQTAEGVLKLQRTSIGRKKIKPSVVSMNLENDKIELSSTLLGNRINMKSELYVNSRKNQESRALLNFNINDLKTLFGILSVNNVYNTSISGDLNGSIRSSFRLSDLKTIDLFLDLKRLFVRKGNKTIYLTEPGVIDIKKSEIKEMSINVQGNGGNYSLVGEGNKRDGYKINQQFSIDLDYITLFTGLLTNIDGRVYGRGEIVGKFGSFSNQHTLSAENISFKLKGSPIQISSGYISSQLKKDVWDVDKLSFKYGNGLITASGRSRFGLKLPEFDFVFNAKDVNVEFLESSSVLLNGKASLTGDKPPYSLTGNIYINGGLIEDEITAFQGKKEYLKSVNKYINVKSEGLASFIKPRFRIQSVEQIIVRNRLADLQLLGDIVLTGSIETPVIEGEIKVVPETSKFKFKGNDFVVKTGLIYFDGTNETRGPGINFESVAKINAYDVKMKVTGDVDSLQLNLESDPILNKDDIFSLLTLGITQDFSKNLDPRDRASLTTIGLGTLLVDQLKINEGLDSTLGLKLSVLPEISESEDSPIQASKLDAQSRVKTATKLRVQKKFSEDIDFTFSNTFGDNSEQKQEINIDYNLNKQWSVQGVFENENTSEDNQEEGSVGADIKYKWTF